MVAACSSKESLCLCCVMLYCSMSHPVCLKRVIDWCTPVSSGVTVFSPGSQIKTLDWLSLFCSTPVASRLKRGGCCGEQLLSFNGVIWRSSLWMENVCLMLEKCSVCLHAWVNLICRCPCVCLRAGAHAWMRLRTCVCACAVRVPVFVSWSQRWCLVSDCMAVIIYECFMAL